MDNQTKTVLKKASAHTKCIRCKTEIPYWSRLGIAILCDPNLCSLCEYEDAELEFSKPIKNEKKKKDNK